MTIILIFFNTLAKFESVYFWHHDIANDDMRV